MLKCQFSLKSKFEKNNISKKVAKWNFIPAYQILEHWGQYQWLYMGLTLSLQVYYMWLYENEHISTQFTVLLNYAKGYIDKFPI